MYYYATSNDYVHQIDNKNIDNNANNYTNNNPFKSVSSLLFLPKMNFSTPQHYEDRVHQVSLYPDLNQPTHNNKQTSNETVSSHAHFQKVDTPSLHFKRTAFNLNSSIPSSSSSLLSTSSPPDDNHPPKTRKLNNFDTPHHTLSNGRTQRWYPSNNNIHTNNTTLNYSNLYAPQNELRGELSPFLTIPHLLSNSAPKTASIEFEQRVTPTAPLGDMKETNKIPEIANQTKPNQRPSRRFLSDQAYSRVNED
jgi:hypothetical protein